MTVSVIAITDTVGMIAIPEMVQETEASMENTQQADRLGSFVGLLLFYQTHKYTRNAQ